MTRFLCCVLSLFFWISSAEDTGLQETKSACLSQIFSAQSSKCTGVVDPESTTRPLAKAACLQLINSATSDLCANVKSPSCLSEAAVFYLLNNEDKSIWPDVCLVIKNTPVKIPNQLMMGQFDVLAQDGMVCSTYCPKVDMKETCIMLYLIAQSQKEGVVCPPVANNVIGENQGEGGAPTQPQGGSVPTQTGSLPGQTQTGSIPGQTQAASFPGQTQTGSLPGQTQAASLPGQTQTGSLPGQKQMGSLSGQTQTGSLPRQTRTG
ncbi:uncharacterized protein LOC106164842, partial [Lingula anatina]|uniref:Uncharacterized protein LOC106164842 n=1 Tax=Lingula anatina TaxID=7574 RepID=A0A1S3IJA9_LINAN